MATREDYRRQVALLIRVLPFVAEQQVFALKGGTAINLFVRDLPRLSVDIDLTYLPVAGRPESLADIDAAMKRIAEHVRKGLPESRVQEAALANEGIDETLRTAFVVYMLSHNRPMAEVLAPTLKDITQDFERDFSGMTEFPVTLDDLVEAREQLISEIVGNMPRAGRRSRPGCYGTVSSTSRWARRAWSRSRHVAMSSSNCDAGMGRPGTTSRMRRTCSSKSQMNSRPVACFV